MRGTLLAIISCCILLLLPYCVSAGAYDRVVGISYANKGGYQFNYPDSRIFAAFDQVSPQNVTAVLPFLLNADPAKFDGAMQELKKRNIIMIPAIGDPVHATIDDDYFKGLAQQYLKYTKYIRLEVYIGYMNTTTALNHVQLMINYLQQIGFQHIMLNPWPKDIGSAKAYPFKGAALEAAFDAVSLDFDHSPPYTVHPNPTNWYPPAAGRVNMVRDYLPTAAFLANYENEPQHLALAGLSKDAQINAMQTTITQINTNGLKEKWVAPWSTNYDPLVEGTWDWIASALKKL